MFSDLPRGIVIGLLLRGNTYLVVKYIMLFFVVFCGIRIAAAFGLVL